MKQVYCSTGMHPLCLEILQREVEVHLIQDPSPQSLMGLAPLADALVVRHSAKVTAEVIRAASRLAVIGRWGVGMDNVDVEAATKVGIPIVYPADAGSVTVAEHTVALILALAKKLIAGDRAVREGRFESARIDFGHCDLEGRTLGLVGLGRIGRRVARVCGSALGMRVIAYDPYLRPRRKELGVKLVKELRDLLAQADFVSLHLPLSSSTRHLLGPGEFALMKRGAFLVNTSRGGIVDEQALVDALRERRISGAGLDVFEDEPPAQGSPLLTLDTTILSPHVAGDTEGAFRRMAPMVAQGVLAVLRGKRPANIFNPEVYARMDRRAGKALPTRSKRRKLSG
jgi:D-3-phosphoglycerate dehydrogenase